MGKFGRTCVSIIPYLFSLASLVCLAIVCVSCNRKTADIENLYFLRVNFSNFTALSDPESIDKIQLRNSTSVEYLSTALHKAQKGGELKDFYSVGLWSYCEGEVADNGSYETTYCSKPRPKFWFNPLDIWRLNGTASANANADTDTDDMQLPSHLAKSLRVYKKVSLWMSTGYIIAITATTIELLLGVLSICSRRGSCITALVSAVACLFTVAGTVTATAIFSVLKGTFATVLRDLDITTTLGIRVLVSSWAAVLCSLAALVFWIGTMCCCAERPDTSRQPDRGPKYSHVGFGPLHPLAMTHEQSPFPPSAPGAGPYPMQPVQQMPYGPQTGGYVYR
ncbi:SUR7/PalI family-domain-containing protein [Aspergillus pseudodeflectus]|uniref:SUR7/PalI family-domain-containing protein n=1 Tax=Aspergillus pseudodeflectus TaxID=176178 RepID=A0ABR4JYF0_9EURO